MSAHEPSAPEPDEVRVAAVDASEHQVRVLEGLAVLGCHLRRDNDAMLALVDPNNLGSAFVNMLAAATAVVGALADTEHTDVGDVLERLRMAAVYGSDAGA